MSKYSKKYVYDLLMKTPASSKRKKIKNKKRTIEIPIKGDIVYADNMFDRVVCLVESADEEKIVGFPLYSIGDIDDLNIPLSRSNYAIESFQLQDFDIDEMISLTKKNDTPPTILSLSEYNVEEIYIKRKGVVWIVTKGPQHKEDYVGAVDSDVFRTEYKARQWVKKKYNNDIKEAGGSDNEDESENPDLKIFIERKSDEFVSQYGIYHIIAKKIQ